MLVQTLIVFLSSLVGLGYGQTAQILLNYPVQAPQAVVAQTEPPATCKVQVQFFDSNSNLVKSQTVYLTPGQSTKVSLSRGDLGARLQPHPLFWAQAALVNNCGNNANCDYTLCNINADGEEQGQD